MTWLLMSVAALVIVMAACVFFGLATVSHIDLGDTADIDDDDEDDTAPTMPYDVVYVNPVPPCAIRHIGASGEHDRYPITQRSRDFWIDYCDASWNLPDREPGATR